MQNNYHNTLIEQKTNLKNMVAKSPFGNFFGISQKTFDLVWSNLNAKDGNSAIYVSMEIGADLDVFNPVKNYLLQNEITDSSDPELNSFIYKTLHGPPKIPNYGGGLGILAGDTLKSFSACKIPVAAISLLYRKGYFSQLVDSKVGQISWSMEWSPEKTPCLYLLKNPDQPNKPLTVEIPFFDGKKNKTVQAYAQIWMKLEVNEKLDFFVPEFLLDFSLPESPEWVRNASNHLYDSSSEQMKALQRRMLGAGVMPLMDILGLTAATIHLNEQHGVVSVLNLISDHLLHKFGVSYQEKVKDSDILEAAEKVSQRVVYTIHTPVKAGHDRFDKSLYAGLSHTVCKKILGLLAGDKDNPTLYNFTEFAMQVNRAVNSVSRLHRDVTKKQFPQYADKITAITNGVHHLTWISEAKAEVFDSFPELKGWRQDPSVFTKAESFLKNKKFRTYLEQAWRHDTELLIQYVNDMLVLHRHQIEETWIDPPNFLSHLHEEDIPLSPSVFTIGFARRFSTYKRADLIFEDVKTLTSIITDLDYPVNFLFAGKAHPADEPGKSLIKIILDIQEEVYELSKGLAKLVFIPNYDMSIAKLMVSGVHAWLNSPKRPLEASGTSGMKAAMNGIPNISILDGWWMEGYHEGKTGWKFGIDTPVDTAPLSEDPAALLYEQDSASFYKIFPQVLKSFYEPKLKSNYIDKCINNIFLNIPIFNTHRMIAEYCRNYGLTLQSPVEKKIRQFQKLYKSEN
ncbi:MAG: alpha-glucan family phosphorylase [Flavobacteriaceae bacterium]|nr:MAG: alpha-glucan family phosphorylase [Flavobacteriaceae bacterium]